VLLRYRDRRGRADDLVGRSRCWRAHCKAPGFFWTVGQRPGRWASPLPTTNALGASQWRVMRACPCTAGAPQRRTPAIRAPPARRQTADLGLPSADGLRACRGCSASWPASASLISGHGLDVGKLGVHDYKNLQLLLGFANLERGALQHSAPACLQRIQNAYDTNPRADQACMVDSRGRLAQNQQPTCPACGQVVAACRPWPAFPLPLPEQPPPRTLHRQAPQAVACPRTLLGRAMP